MSHLYITGTARRTGKSALSLGFMDRLSASNGNVAYFRPIIMDENDSVMRLMRSRYGSHEGAIHYGLLASEARPLLAAGEKDEVIKRILSRFQVLEHSYSHILCEGVDYAASLPGEELDFNLELANHLGCQVVAVLDGFQHDPSQLCEDLQALQETLEEHHSAVFALFINRVEPELMTDLKEKLKCDEELAKLPLYLIRQQPLLDMPSVGEVAQALNAKVLAGSPASLEREVVHFQVAAMELPHFLRRVQDGSLVITPGDRSDLIVGSLMADASRNYPQIAGVLLTGGLTPAPEVMRLVDGLGRANLPILLVETDTFTTAMAASRVESHLNPENPRKLAAALALTEELEIDCGSLIGDEMADRSERTTPLRFEYEIIQRARSDRQHIVLPEGAEERVLRAAEVLLLREVADITLLGDVDEIRAKAAHLALRLDKAQLIDPSRSPLRQRYADALFAARQSKGLTTQGAWDLAEDVSYFGTLMVQCGDADGMVSGAVHTTQHTIRPAFQLIRTAPGHELISSVFLMSLADRVLVYGDCAVNPEPNAEQLAEIAITSAATAERFGIIPRVAMLSYSTGDSGEGEAVDKVRQAVAIARRQAPWTKLEGPIQFDAAVDPAVARTKLPGSEVAGRATVFIFPDLNTGNNTYKAVQRTAGAVAIGPILQGLNKPVNDLSRGCTVTDIVNTVAITAIQAQGSNRA
ncbi:MAG: phosphate acetyltransferase [Gammaproteobacteria bacterium]|nr:phosphate acetyltransferase [Gammaproteobacteria bacterium]